MAQLQPTQGSKVSGSLQFTAQADGSVRVQGSVQGLAPNSEHGFHVHEKGDCSSPDGLSAGGHFNPTGQAHGRFDSSTHHTGDLPSRSEEHTSELQSPCNLVCRLLLEKKNNERK